MSDPNDPPPVEPDPADTACHPFQDGGKGRNIRDSGKERQKPARFQPADRGKHPRRAESVIVALLNNPSVVEAAKAAGMAERTLRGWLQQPEFRRAYQEARRDLVDAALVRLQRSCTSAAEALEEIVSDVDAKPAVRVAAARAILDSVMKVSEQMVLVERIEELERRQTSEGR